MEKKTVKIKLVTGGQLVTNNNEPNSIGFEEKYSKLVPLDRYGEIEVDEDMEDEYEPDDDEQIEESYDRYISTIAENYRELAEDSLETLEDISEDSEFLFPDHDFLNFLSRTDSRLLYEQLYGGIEIEELDKYLKKINSYRTTLKVHDFLYIHVYGKKKKSKQFNQIVRKRLKPLIEQLETFQEKTMVMSEYVQDHIHLFPSDNHENVYKGFYAFKISDDKIDFSKKVFIPLSNFIRIAQKRTELVDVKISEMKLHDCGLYGYDNDCLNTYSFVLSFIGDFNEKIRFDKSKQRSFEERCVVNIQEPDSIDELDGVSEFLPEPQRLLMRAAFCGLENIDLDVIMTTGKRVVDIEIGELYEEGEYTRVNVKCKYDNGIETLNRLFCGCSFTNMWMQLLKSTDYKADYPEIYDKLLAWYRGDD